MFRIAEYPPIINTGALVKVRRKGRTVHLSMVEPSAASHVAPRDPFAREAPRIYGEFAKNDVKSAWIHWIVGLIDPELSFETDSLARAYIDNRLEQIPEE